MNESILKIAELTFIESSSCVKSYYIDTWDGSLYLYLTYNNKGLEYGNTFLWDVYKFHIDRGLISVFNETFESTNSYGKAFNEMLRGNKGTLISRGYRHG